MSSLNPSIDKIFEMVENHQITSEEGFRLIKNKSNNNQTTVKLYPIWEKSPLDEQSIKKQMEYQILLFDMDDTRHSNFKEHLKSEVILVTPGESYQKLGPQTYSINPNHLADYQKLLAALNLEPSHIIHLWSQTPFVSDKINAQLEISLFSIFHLSQALLSQKPQNPIQLLYIYLETPKALQPQYAALSGFAKTIRLENPKLNYKTVALPNLDNVVDIALTEFQTPDIEVRYDKGQRWIKRLQELDGVPDAQTTPKLKENGVYLITGGAGGLGLIFAEYLAKHFKAKLVLTGRSELNQEQFNKIQSLNTLGTQVIYHKADISKRDEVKALIAQTKSRFQEINGIIHSAGVIKDALVIKKTPVDMAAVLAPKVYGTIYLDEVTQNEPLDFFVLFSSIASVMGNLGQCDYAYANGFMDNFALWRSKQCLVQKRFGKTLSINWPLWQNGGMHVDAQTEKWLTNTMGMQALSTETGIEAFSHGLGYDMNQFLVVEGYRSKVRKGLGFEATVSQPTPTIATSSAEKSQLLAKFQQDLLALAGTILKISVKDIDLNDDISEYGFDSISFTELTNQINEKYSLDLTPAIFFEYPSMEAFSQFLCDQYFENLLDYYMESFQTVSPASPKMEMAEVTDVVEIKLKSRFIEPVTVREVPRLLAKMPIAIIGMSGVMPQSADLESFWQHLESGDDLITEVPYDRWDWQAYYGDPTIETNKTKAKWGGFLPEVDKFDPLFFGISPREAELMDPQQRLFLETVWKTIEDAGYKASDLSGTKTGLFVGVATHDYDELLRKNVHDIEAHSSTGLSHSILANRISYLLNLHGPSEPIDTACSSSLVAIHRAIEAIRSGTCEMAIAGGVNVMLTPTLTLSFSKAGMLSDDGRCKTFDKRANGYVRGEGVGAIWLKPLPQAQADGDRIYAVIKGTAENHGGHATSLTAPNPNAQTQLLISAFDDAQIDPSTISYIETHGTGTRLGDPIEINGLKNAFATLYNKSGKSLPEKPHCGIGSVKTNIGHLETAAGIAGVLKVLLALKHQTLPGLLHFSELNPYVQLQDSPFYIVTENQTWTPLTDTSGKNIPRRAGVSSFGFGGANAHIVLEEYESKLFPIANASNQLIVLSAKNDERLQAYAKLVAEFLEKQPDILLSNLAYTLQVGREAMEERLAIVASSVDDLKDKLTQYVQGQTEIDDFYRGNVKTSKIQSELLIEGEAGEAFLRIIIEKKELSKLALLWVSGVEIDWQLLYPNQKPQRISLPTYPFARERYWIPVSEREQGQIPVKMYYQSVWEPEVLEEQMGTLTSTTVLLFDTDSSRYWSFKERFSAQVILVTPGECYQELGPQTYSINPKHPADYQSVLAALSLEPSHIIHLWSQAPFVSHKINAQLEMGLFSIFHLSQALLSRQPQNPIQLLYIYLETPEALQPQYAALSGFAKTIGLENPKLNYKTLALPDLDNVVEIVQAEFQAPDIEVRYSHEQRWIKRLQEFDEVPALTNKLTENGVYLITGGAGGLGLIFAEYLAKHFRARLVLTGRSELNPEQIKKIQSLNTLGASVIYHKADVSIRDEVRELIAQTKSRFNEINGIIHSAGVIKDAFVLKKTSDDMAAVLAPKVYGTIHLDEATQNEPLDFFVLFSSVAAVMGNVGQCDYAYANSFMDNFAFWRSEQCLLQQRFGKTLSINWPLWQEGGMQVDDQTAKWLTNTMGIQALSTKIGLEAFSNGLGYEKTQFMVLEGYRQKVKKGLGIEEDAVPSATRVPANTSQLLETLQTDLLCIAAAILKIDEHQIDLNEKLNQYGFESIGFLTFANRINEIYHLKVTQTLFFEYASIASLAQFLYSKYQDNFNEYYQLNKDIVVKDDKALKPQETIDSDELYSLSHGQQALWFLYHRAPESVAYNIALTLRIRSLLSVTALQNTFQALSNRHPCLRTTFTLSEGKPFQKVHQYQPIRFEQIDASTWSWDELNKRVIEAYKTPFNLEQGPVLRVNLFTRAEQDHILLLTIHHIVFDAWSLWMLIEELGTLYPIIKAGHQASVPVLKHTYADFVRWQMDMLAREERLWTYWQQQLAGELPVLNLPTDHPRPPAQTYRGASVQFIIAETLTQPLKKLAQTENASLYMVILAAYQILLYRYTGQKDILVGSATTGRTQNEFTDIVGYFVNMVVLRAKLQSSFTFKAFLGQVRQTVLAALDHQDYPFPLLVERLQPSRDSSHSPVFQVDFVYQKPQRFEKIIELFAPSETGVRVNLGELELEPFEMAQQEGQFDLTLDMVEVKNSLVSTFKYNTDLFEATTITRMIGHFQTLLEGIVANSLQPISELPLLTKAEWHKLLVEWNETQTAYPQDKCIHQLFETQVERTPNAIAVAFENQRLNYATLNNKANQLAHYLQTLSVKSLVGICVERSLEMIIGLLGILKAGNAYIPLDPAYPAERIAFMLEDAGVSVLLTQESLKDKLPKTGAKMVCLDTEAQTFAQFSQENTKSSVTPDNLAYVIYTSGSTGKPKGVAIEHHSTVMLLNWAKEVFTPKEISGVLASTSICFDLSVFEIFVPLSWGGSIILVENALHLSTVSNDLNITLVNTVPSAMAELIRTDSIPTSVSVVNLAGEALKNELVQQIYQQETVQKVFNLYGPSEDTTYSTFALIKKGSTNPPTIGRPIANTQIYILDDHLQPTPIGVPGELYIGGSGLARAYLNRPELTAERFILNPFSDDPKARLYKTGDLARYLPDSNIEYLDRIDHQVKIRGFRIELGEIESVLLQHALVREVVVVSRESSSNEKILVAYVVPNQTISSRELRHDLKKKLPDYMVPSIFVMLEAMPMTPNGKINRRALPAPENTIHQETPLVSPTQPTEKILATIWSEILGQKGVSIFDNFFEIGGTSLLATRLIFKVRESFSIHLAVSDLFESPTIAGLAEVIDDSKALNKSDGLSKNDPKTDEKLLTIFKRLAQNELDIDEVAQWLN
jgi:amino acid adenylation domain-containing protein